MIIYQNSLIRLRLSAENNILSVEWPDSAPYAILEVKQPPQKLVEIMRNYAVKNLLIDASKAPLTLSDKEFREMVVALATNLEMTYLQKLARIKTSEPFRKMEALSIPQEMNFPYEFQEFETKEDALQWLISA